MVTTALHCIETAHLISEFVAWCPEFVGDHQGHEYFFHKTGAGGCCDCGDAEAWADSGGTIDH